MAIIMTLISLLKATIPLQEIINAQGYHAKSIDTSMHFNLHPIHCLAVQYQAHCFWIRYWHIEFHVC
jgi:hypothetical protein